MSDLFGTQPNDWQISTIKAEAAGTNSEKMEGDEKIKSPDCHLPQQIKTPSPAWNLGSLVERHNSTKYAKNEITLRFIGTKGDLEKRGETENL